MAAGRQRRSSEIDSSASLRKLLEAGHKERNRCPRLKVLSIKCTLDDNMQTFSRAKSFYHTTEESLKRGFAHEPMKSDRSLRGLFGISARTLTIGTT